MISKEIEQSNNAILDRFTDGWITILIDHTYNRINLYDTIGLNHIKDLGDDYKEWLADDLFTYTEIDKDELIEIVNTNNFKLY